jgi:hypothetical protein
MSFLQALASGRPMRRESTMMTPEWLALGYEGTNDVVGMSCWREVRSGNKIGLRRADYEATDWEILP